MKKLNLLEHKMVLTAAAVGAGFILLWVLLYLPRLSYMNRLKAEWAKAEGKIHQLESLVTREDVGAGIIRLKKQLQLLDVKFPSKEEKSLKLLSDIARKVNLEVISVVSQPKVDVLDDVQQKIISDGKICQSISVSMEIRGSYKDFVKYIETLKLVLPAYVSFERLQLVRAPDTVPGAQLLNIQFNLNLFLLS